MYESSLSAKRNLTTEELKVWSHAAAYTKANSSLLLYFLTYNYFLLLFCIYTVAASKPQIRTEATAVQDSCRQQTKLTRKYSEGTC